MPSTYVLLAGLPGTGKSTLAAALAARLPNPVVLNKDDVRAALFPGAATDYSDGQNDLAMASLLSAARYLCHKPGGAQFLLIDGRTFCSAAQVAQVTESAEANGASWIILALHCRDDIALARIAAGSTGHPAKNRNAELYRKLKQRCEPIRQPHLLIDTGRPLELCVEDCLTYIDCEITLPGQRRVHTLSIQTGEVQHMDKFAIWAQMEAKPGKEAEVEAFLKSAQPMAEAEAGTTTWFAVKMGPGKYGIFDTFADEDARKAHLSGDIAKALFAKAKDLFVKDPEVDTPVILAAKVPGV